MLQPVDPSSLARAAAIVRRGGLVAFPTETVYGLGADATNPQAVARIFEVKGRPRFDPIIVHVASLDEARASWTSCPEPATTLMRALWPGPLTLVLPKTDRMPDLVTAGLPRVGVRMPDHPVALELIRQAGCPIAAPSANRFGCSSPTTAQAVEEDLGDAIDLILDGGPTTIGIESTVVAIEEGRPVLLRPGGVSLEALTEVAGPVVVPEPRARRTASPGRLERHYAPRTPLYLLQESGTPVNGRPATGAIGFLSLTAMPLPVPVSHAEVLSPTGDLVEAAAHFFQALRRLDQRGLHLLIAAPMPLRGLGLALMDRLTKAASGRAWISHGGLRVTER